MQILVLSCDKNTDLGEPFHHCMEKYGPEHPEIIYSTESRPNPYYKTICVNYPLDKWTLRIKRTLDVLEDDKILIMIDDCFIRNRVDIERVNYTERVLKGNMACLNYEKAFDKTDLLTNIDGFKQRRHGAKYEISIMCGLGDKQKLKDVLGEPRDPWSVELKPNNHGYDFYINSGDYIIDGGYKTFHEVGVLKGKWCKEVIPFFEKEGIVVDYSKRGFK